MTKLYLVPPHNDKNYMLVLESSDSALLTEFRGQGFATLPKSLRPLLQIDYDDCKGWEFWSSDYTNILDACFTLARHLNVDLQLA